MTVEPAELGARRRAAALERLSGERFDLLVIGAGIVGARVAYEAARAGLRVALVDAGDFGGATSSASSKLLHGGLRYLFSGKLALVRRAQRERSALATSLGSHLAREFGLVLAVPHEERRAAPAIAAGVRLYSALAGGDRPAGTSLRVAEACALVPALAGARLAACSLLREGQTHDGRLVLATVAGAARAGAVVANHLRVVALERSRGRTGAAVVETPEGGPFVIRFHAVVNASGPWIELVRRLEDPRCRPIARFSKGVHVVLPGPTGWRAGVALYLGGVRAAFVLPWHGLLLVGVTDTPFDGDPGAALPTRADVDELLGSLAPVLPPSLVNVEEVRSAFAGVRVLPLGPGDTLRASREHVTAVGTGGMVSVAGGKLTLHRQIAADALRRLPADVRPRRLSPDGAGAPHVRRTAFEGVPVDAGTRDHLLACYGDAVAHVLRYAETAPDALEPIVPGTPDVWAQAYHAVADEWAVTAADVLRRRTSVGLRGLAAPALMAHVEERLGLTPVRA